MRPVARSTSPGQAGRGESRLWSVIGIRVARHPARVALAAVVLLCAACAGLATLRIDNSNLAQVKGHPGSVAGAQLADDHFPAGLLEPVVILAPPDQARAAATAARATANVSTVLAVSVAVELGDAGQALELSRDVDSSQLSPERLALKAEGEPL